MSDLDDMMNFSPRFEVVGQPGAARRERRDRGVSAGSAMMAQWQYQTAAAQVSAA